MRQLVYASLLLIIMLRFTWGERINHQKVSKYENNCRLLRLCHLLYVIFLFFFFNCSKFFFYFFILMISVVRILIFVNCFSLDLWTYNQKVSKYYEYDCRLYWDYVIFCVSFVFKCYFFNCSNFFFNSFFFFFILLISAVILLIFMIFSLHL